MAMEASIIKVSSKGQIVIPAGLREEMEIGEGDEFQAFGKDGVIILKVVRKRDLEREFEEILEWGSRKARVAGITRSDVKKSIRAARKAKKHEGRR